MEIDYLKEFIAAAEICNLFETSEQLFVSQSTLSRHIKSLEDSLGVQLFDRLPRNFKINRNGMIFLDYARQIVAIEAEGRKVLELEQEKYRDVINISTINSVCNYHINDILGKFKVDYPQYLVNIFESDSIYNLEQLQKRECDFAFVLEAKGEYEGLERIPYMMDELVAVVPKGHMLSGREYMTFEDLRDESLLLFGKNSLVYQLCMERFEEIGIKPKVVFTSYRSETLVDMVDKNMGLALMMRKEAEACCREENCIVGVYPCVQTNISLVYRKELEMKPVNRKFIACVKSFL